MKIDEAMKQPSPLKTVPTFASGNSVPYPEIIVDETSGIEVSNPEYVAYQRGRVEVVEWLENHLFLSRYSREILEAQKRIWGIEEVKD